MGSAGECSSLGSCKFRYLSHFKQLRRCQRCRSTEAALKKLRLQLAAQEGKMRQHTMYIQHCTIEGFWLLIFDFGTYRRVKVLQLRNLRKGESIGDHWINVCHRNDERFRRSQADGGGIG